MMKNKENYYYDLPEKEIEVESIKNTEIAAKKEMIIEKIKEYISSSDIIEKEKIKEKNKEIIEKYLHYNNNTEDFKEIINDDFGKQCLKEEAKFTACAF